MKKFFSGLTLLLLGCAIAHAQPLLTPEEAVRLTLANNFSISLARDQSAAAKLNRQSAVGPFLPSLSASLNNEGRLTDSITRVTTVGASLNWQIFNGLQSYNTYQSLKSSEQAARL